MTFLKSWFYNPCSTPLVENNSVVSHNIFWQMHVDTFVRRSSWRCFRQHSIHTRIKPRAAHRCLQNDLYVVVTRHSNWSDWMYVYSHERVCFLKKNHGRIIVPCQCGWNWRPDRPRESFCSYSLYTAWLQSRRAAAGDTINTLNTH